MSERLRSMSDEALGGALSALDLAWPPTPDLARSVMAAIMLIAAATVLLLAGAAVAAKIVIDLGAVVVNVTPSVPGPHPTTSVAPTGEPVTLEEAGALLGRAVAVPGRLGRPERIWADEVFTEAGEVARITMAWRPRPDLPEIPGTRFGAVLMVFEGDANQASKDIYADTGVLRFETVDGVEYYWTSGAHVLELLTSEGVVFVRVEGNVLLWRDGPFTKRLETSVPRADAIRIARSAGTP
jgi:hypothetical protein